MKEEKGCSEKIDLKSLHNELDSQFIALSILTIATKQ
jgi:hypothetical protein